MKVAGTSSFIGTRLSPSVKIGLPVCVAPWISVDVASSDVGTTGVILGVYVVSTVVPFVSAALNLNWNNIHLNKIYPLV